MRSANSSRCVGIILILLSAAAVSTQTLTAQSKSPREKSPAVTCEDLAKRKHQVLPKPLGNDAAMLDINLLEFGVSNFGNLAYDPDAEGYHGLYYPAGQRWGSVLYTGGIWLVGKVGGDIRCASCQYSTEYKPGMILPDGTADDPADDKYQVYKFNAGNPPSDAAIAQGCPPELMGDQMLFSVFNDLGSHAYLNDTEPLGVEVQQTTWGYDEEGTLANVVFSRFRIINKGGNQINDAYFAVFYDPDIGDMNDDATGADSVLGLLYGYNGDNYDENYGRQVPAFASDFLQGPIVDATGETAVLNDGTVLLNKKVLRQTAAVHYL